MIMIHKFTVLVELTYDDENGEYPPPSLTSIERGIYDHNYVRHEGFKLFNIEAAKGNPKEAFGI